MASRCAAWLLAMGLVAVAAVTPLAHELGTTRVRLSFAPDGTFAGDVETDANALLEKLEAMAGQTDSPNQESVDARLRRLVPLFWSRVQLTLDGVATQPPLQTDVIVTPAARLTEAPVAHLRWRGDWTPRAQVLTWRYGWTFTPYALAVATGRQDPAVIWLDGNEVSAPIALSLPAGSPGDGEGAPPARGRWTDTAWRYLGLGFQHILPLGSDHVLFVLGLCLLGARPRALLAQVSAFTLAHSLTLAATAAGLVTVPAAIVEPLIAVSIAYVAVENLIARAVTPTRIAVVFACGLLHGFGFAGVLRDAGVPAGQFLVALAAFNGGVEVAQLVVVACALLVLGGPALAGRHWYRERVVIPVSLAIAVVAAWWVIERMPAMTGRS